MRSKSLSCRARLRPAVLAFLCLLAALVPSTAQGQQLAAPVAADPAQPGSELSVYLVTMGPGELVYERFGHNALMVRDHARGTDILYNYGLFDFEQENFLLRFVQGRMLYSMAGTDAARSIDHYIWDNRSVWLQELNLSPQQRAELRDFLEWNERPENRDYRYDYYRDNCSTRVRDALDHVLGGQIRRQTENVAAGTTYRFHTQRLTTNDVPIYTGLMLGLGQNVDRPISLWEELFLPLAMREHVREMTIRHEDGQEVPLVRAEQTLFLADRGPLDEAPPAWLLGYLLTGLALGGLFVMLARAVPRSRWARLGFAASTALWTLLVGTLGTVVAGLWAFTDHAAAYQNENLFHFNPLWLPLVILLPTLAYGAVWARRPAYWLTLGLAALSLLGLVLKILPGLYQVNGQLVALALPAHAGLALAVYYLSVLGPRSASPPVPKTPAPTPRRRGVAPAR